MFGESVGVGIEPSGRVTSGRRRWGVEAALMQGEDSRYPKVCPGCAANRWWPVEGSGS